ncbi:DUF3533 domain-containing protein [Antrihabitans sp. YC2-6]|uniref:YhgE/Pip domain-containing protein n=1 Tax=Antrihabitans sp. YC2-6 TaxID=2799498 RepID=UPI0027DE2FBC|nr:DUF3533 domain-containing protein [Antrihabitans sp. YC2-6]
MTSNEGGAAEPDQVDAVSPTGESPGLKRLLGHPRVWLPPIVVVTLLMSLLAVLYLDSILDPRKNLHDFPIALVNQDEGEGQNNYGDQIAENLVAQIPSDKIAVREVGIGSAESMLRKGEVYGAIIIPSDFSKIMSNLAIASGANAPGDITKPLITVRTNPRAGPFATGIVTAFFDEAMTQVNAKVGEQLTAELQKAVGPDGELPAVTKLTVSEPVNVHTVAFNPLPDGTGNGLSAFYYSLLLLLAGFTGAMIVSSLVDARLGFAPAEFGPWFMFNPSAHVSRFHTLLVKWGIMIVVGIVVSAIYVGISAFLDMPMSRAPALFAFGAYAIAAVGITAVSVMAAFGTAGLLINLVIFIVLGVPSSGGTVPLEGQPPFFGWLANFEPLHQVFVGVRAILYFDARYDSGLLHGFLMTTFGLGFGLVLGVIATRIYDRKGFKRGAI